MLIMFSSRCWNQNHLHRKQTLYRLVPLQVVVQGQGQAHQVDLEAPDGAG